MNAAQAVTEAILETIRAIPEGVPSGHLYAMLMSYGVDLETYELFIGSLVASGKIRKSNDLLIAVVSK